MRIVHVTPYYPPAWAYGGPVRVVQALCEELASRGHDVTVLTTDARDAAYRVAEPEETREGVRVLRLRNLSNRLAWQRIILPLGARPRLRQVLGEADIAHLHEARSALHLAARPILRRTGIPYVLTAHGSLPFHAQRSLFKRTYDLLGGQSLLEGACRLHAISNLEAAQYEVGGMDSSRVSTIPNGIFPAEYDHLPDGSAFREALGVGPLTPLVLFLSRLHPIKGVHFLLDAFARLHQRLPDAVLALVGPDDGAGKSALKRVEALGLTDSVRFVWGVSNSEKFDAYRAADAYVLPSRYDVFSIGLVEAMAAGAPVVVSRGCALAGDVAQQGAGLVVDYGDVDALSDALYTTLTERDAARQRAAHAREWALATFGWDRIVDAMQAVYEACLEPT